MLIRPIMGTNFRWLKSQKERRISNLCRKMWAILKVSNKSLKPAEVLRYRINTLRGHLIHRIRAGFSVGISLTERIANWDNKTHRIMREATRGAWIDSRLKIRHSCDTYYMTALKMLAHQISELITAALAQVGECLSSQKCTSNSSQTTHLFKTL